MHEALGGQIALSSVIVLVMQSLKNSNAKWISTDTDRLNRALALMLSGAAALGIHWAYEDGFSWVNGGHISILWPGFMGMGHAAWDWLQSFAVQEWIYRSGVKKV